MTNILIIDNYDSYTYNIASHISKISKLVNTKIRVKILLSNESNLNWIHHHISYFNGVIISPGPGTPTCASDAGICFHVIELCSIHKIPILGICFGFQCLALKYNLDLDYSTEPFHGRRSIVNIIEHSLLFRDFPPSFRATRYHSINVVGTSDTFVINALTSDGIPMSGSHISLPFYGVQFHPESIYTEYGLDIFNNWIRPLIYEAPGKIPKPLQKNNISYNSRGIRLLTSEKKHGEIDFNMLLKKFHFHNVLFIQDTNSQRETHTYFALRQCKFLTISLSGIDGPDDLSTFFKNVPDRDFKSILHNVMCILSVSQLSTTTQPWEINPLSLVGHLNYEAKNILLPGSFTTTGPPGSFVCLVSNIFKYNHSTNELSEIIINQPGISFTDIIGWETPKVSCAMISPEIKFRDSKKSYISKVKSCIEEIRLGNSYELCLTSYATANSDPCIYCLYKHLRRINYTQYICLYNITEAFISASPETFCHIKLDSNNYTIVMKPMKGTMPRGKSEKDDGEIKYQLSTSVKDIAENLMIVDLVRNDLSRTMDPSSTRVNDLFKIIKFPHYFQMISKVTAKTDDIDMAIDTIFSLFPPGSMTGAPKIRSMEILEKIEENMPRRGYSGFYGFFTPGNNCKFAVNIRSIMFSKNNLTLNAGGAITWLSDPTDEYFEAIVKLRPSLLSIASFTNRPVKFKMDQNSSILILPPIIMSIGHHLIETMRIENNSIYFLNKHIQRILSSCVELFKWSKLKKNLVWMEIKKKLFKKYKSISPPIHDNKNEWYLDYISDEDITFQRLLINLHGEITIDMVKQVKPRPKTLGIQSRILRDSIDQRWQWKYSDNRKYFNEFLDIKIDDVLIFNEKSFLCETSIGNVAIFINNTWLTPPENLSLKPSIFRDFLVECGYIHVGDISMDDVKEIVSLHNSGESVRVVCFNSARFVWIPEKILII